MLNDKAFNIIHISDLHFGEKSIARDSGFGKSFEDFFTLLITTIEKIMQDYSIKILIISGDISSKGDMDQLQNKYLMEFLQIFIKRSIPICIANGNHDLDLNSIESKSQFKEFTNFLKKKKKEFNVNLSKDFRKNQVSFKYLKDYNSIFIAVNSCKYIEKRLINDEIRNLNVEDRNKYLNQKYLDIGVLSMKDLSNILTELEDNFGKIQFSNMNKFLICHHSLKNLEDNKISINFLEENDLHLIFSGHEHNYYYWNNQIIKNIGAGSLLVYLESRKNNISLNEVPIQFNIYAINVLKGKIQPILYYYNKDCKWVSESRKIVIFNPKIYYPIESWFEFHQIREEKRKRIKTNQIIGVYEVKNNKSSPSLTFIDKNGTTFNGFLIEETDTQGFIDQINKWFIENYNSIISGELNPLIIKNTTENRFFSQLPEEYVI